MPSKYSSYDNSIGLVDRMDALKTSISDIQKDIQDYDSVATLKSDISAAASREAALETRVEAAEGDAGTAETAVSGLEASKESAKTAIDGAYAKSETCSRGEVAAAFAAAAANSGNWVPTYWTKFSTMDESSFPDSVKFMVDLGNGYFAIASGYDDLALTSDFKTFSYLTPPNSHLYGLLYVRGFYLACAGSAYYPTEIFIYKSPDLRSWTQIFTFDATDDSSLSTPTISYNFVQDHSTGSVYLSLTYSIGYVSKPYYSNARRIYKISPSLEVSLMASKRDDGIMDASICDMGFHNGDLFFLELSTAPDPANNNSYRQHFKLYKNSWDSLLRTYPFRDTVIFCQDGVLATQYSGEKDLLYEPFDGESKEMDVDGYYNNGAILDWRKETGFVLWKYGKTGSYSGYSEGFDGPVKVFYLKEGETETALDFRNNWAMMLCGTHFFTIKDGTVYRSHAVARKDV